MSTCRTAITRRAINQLEALAALEPTRADRLVAVGLAQARAGREDAAVVTLGRAVERFPDAPQVYAALGHVWLTEAAAPRRSRRAQQGDRSAAACGRAERMRRATPTRSSGARGCSPAIGQAAERALRQAVAKLPVPPDAYLRLAEVTGARRTDPGCARCAAEIRDARRRRETARDRRDADCRLLGAARRAGAGRALVRSRDR